MSEALRRLGDVVRARREALNLTQRDAETVAGVSHQTWWQVENGRSASQRTLRAVDRAMRWKPGSARSVLEGKDPAEDPDLGPATLEDCRRRIMTLEAALADVQAQMARLAARAPNSDDPEGRSPTLDQADFNPGARAQQLAQSRSLQPPSELQLPDEAKPSTATA